MASLLVKDARILTQDARRRLVQGDLLARDGRVVALGGDLGLDADVVVEADGDLLLPGLVNLHTHAAMTLLRGLGDDLALEEWLRTRIWPAERALTRADVEAGADLALLEMIRGGTTAFNDMYFFADATAERAAAAGMRAGVAATFIDFDTPEMPTKHMEAYARRFVDRWRDHSLVQPFLGPHATYTCSDDTLAAVRRVREDTGARVHTHCCETRFEVQDVLEKRGARPVEVLRRSGLLDEAILAHCGWVTKEEIRALGEHAAHAAHCPVSNLKLGTGGVMPLVEMLDADVNVALGTDGAASNNSLDLFETAKFAALVQKQHRWDPRAAPAGTILGLATKGGARALGLDAGSLEPGKLADLALVSTDGPHLAPLHDPVSALVYAARAGDVRGTIVDGRILHLDGDFATLEPADVMKRAGAAAERMRRAAQG